MNIIHRLFGVFCVLMCSSVVAQAPSSKYLDIAYSDVSDSSDMNGFTYRVGLEVSDSIYFDTNRYKLKGPGSSGSPELDVQNYGFGIKFDLTQDSFLYVDYSKLKLSDENNNRRKGKVESVGYRGVISDSFELQLEYHRTDFDDSNESSTGSIVGLHYTIDYGSRIFIEKADWLDLDIITLGFRFSY